VSYISFCFEQGIQNFMLELSWLSPFQWLQYEGSVNGNSCSWKRGNETGHLLLFILDIFNLAPHAVLKEMKNNTYHWGRCIPCQLQLEWL